MKLDAFQRLALWTTGATYLLIGVGGLVRAAGAGLGCPDWPKCFDRWIPPITAGGVPSHIDPALFNFARAWLEYVNRLLGVAVGFLILGTFVLAWVRYRDNPRVVVTTTAAFLLVLFQGWLGGQVVRTSLEPLVLTAHLVLALVIVTLLLYATVSAFFAHGRRPRPLSAGRRRLGWAVLGVIGLVLIQVGVGAGLRGAVQLAAEAGVAKSLWLHEAGSIDTVHRSLAVVVVMAIIVLSRFGEHVAPQDDVMRGLGRGALLLVGLQVAAGIGLGEWAFPGVLVVSHLWGAALLLGVLTLWGLLVVRLDPREVRADASR